MCIVFSSWKKVKKENKKKKKKKKKKKHDIQILLKHIRTWVVVESTEICDHPVILPH